MELKWENGEVSFENLPDPVLQRGVEEPRARRGGPMMDKILDCRIGHVPLIHRWFSLYRLVCPCATTKCHGAFFQAANEWNRMQMRGEEKISGKVV